jgi:hypothetical protein
MWEATAERGALSTCWEHVMSSASWSVVETTALLLDSEEREVVLGDLAESGESTWRVLLGVIGLVARRQAAQWKSRRPWLAALVVLPSSYLLMYVTISVSFTSQRLILHKTFRWGPTGNEGFLLLLCHVFLMLAWSWAAGFIVGSTSRRTVWASAVLCSVPILFYWPGFQQGFLPRLSVILFLVPGILGVKSGLRTSNINLSIAVLLAVAVTVSMISAWSNAALWYLNWLLILPPWYLVATARRSRELVAFPSRS